MMLVPEATLTRSKYWMNDYPIVIQDLQILDKQIHNKQQLEKSKVDANDFFTNTATVLSIWFETSPQKEEWFHKQERLSPERNPSIPLLLLRLSLVLRKGKEEIERANNLPSPTSTSSLYRRLPQTESDTELVPKPVSESTIHASVLETQISAVELQEKAKVRSNFPPSKRSRTYLDHRT